MGPLCRGKAKFEIEDRDPHIKFLTCHHRQLTCLFELTTGVKSKKTSSVCRIGRATKPKIKGTFARPSCLCPEGISMQGLGIHMCGHWHVHIHASICVICTNIFGYQYYFSHIYYGTTSDDQKVYSGLARSGHARMEDLKFIVQTLRGHMWTKKGWWASSPGVGGDKFLTNCNFSPQANIMARIVQERKVQRTCNHHPMEIRHRVSACWKVFRLAKRN